MKLVQVRLGRVMGLQGGGGNAPAVGGITLGCLHAVSDLLYFIILVFTDFPLFILLTDETDMTTIRNTERRDNKEEIR